MSELMRANKVTAYWEGEGIAVGQFYKTHTKIMTVKSNEDSVVNAGFAFPEGTEEAPVTAQQKLEAFKNFIMVNASTFGITYDPVDRRADEFKYPSRYNEENIKEWSKKALEGAIGAALEKVQNNVIANMIKSGNLEEGTKVEFGIDEGEVNVTEEYKNGAYKYADVTYTVAFAIGDARVDTIATVELVSGQLKKPREVDGSALTMTGLKAYFTENGLLPVIEKKKKEAEVADENDGDAIEEAVAVADAE